MSELEGLLKLVKEYGLDVVLAVGVGIGFAVGKIRWEREVTRERQIGDGKDQIIATLTEEVKAQTVTMNRLADGIEERNRIEREMRGRRT